VIVAVAACWRCLGLADAVVVTLANLALGDPFVAGRTLRREHCAADAGAWVALAELARNAEVAAVFGHAASALAGLAGLLDLTERPGQEAEAVLLVRVGRTDAVAGRGVAFDLVALVEGRERAALGLANAFTELADTVELAKIDGGALGARH
jgi:hypothetical protein